MNKYLILLVFILFSSNAVAYSLNIRDVYFESAGYVGKNYDSYLDMDSELEQLSYIVACGWDLDLFRYGKNLSFYWDNRVEGKSSTRQFRHVSWKFQFGFNLYNAVDIFYFHESQHLLDMDRPKSESLFPLENFIGIRLHFIGG